MDPALAVLSGQEPKGEPLRNPTEPAAAPAAPATEESDDDGPPALEEGLPERPDDAVDEDEVKAAAELAGGVTKLDLNKKHDVYKLNLAHQETDRILNEVEANCEAVIQAGGVDAWIPIPGLQQFVFKELGYEDVDEFEDALGGTFLAFLESLPHIEVMTEIEGENAGRIQIRMRPPEGDGRGFVKKLLIKESSDLWRVLYKAPDATITIPKIDFFIGRSEKRQLDAIYNHLGTSMFNLSQHVSNGQVDGAQKEGILQAVDELSGLLDINEPWEIVVTDTSGKSIFKPEDGVETLALDPADR